jgi:hypothetical protein
MNFEDNGSSWERIAKLILNNEKSGFANLIEKLQINKSLKEEK